LKVTKSPLSRYDIPTAWIFHEKNFADGPLGHWFTGVSAFAVNPTTIDRAPFPERYLEALVPRSRRRRRRGRSRRVTHPPAGSELHREERRTRVAWGEKVSAVSGGRSRVRRFRPRGDKKEEGRKERRRRSSSPGRRSFLSPAGSTPPRVGSAAAPQNQ